MGEMNPSDQDSPRWRFASTKASVALESDDGEEHGAPFRIYQQHVVARWSGSHWVQKLLQVLSEATTHQLLLPLRVQDRLIPLLH